MSSGSNFPSVLKEPRRVSALFPHFAWRRCITHRHIIICRSERQSIENLISLRGETQSTSVTFALCFGRQFMDAWPSQCRQSNRPHRAAQLPATPIGAKSERARRREMAFCDKRGSPKSGPISAETLLQCVAGVLVPEAAISSARWARRASTANSSPRAYPRRARRYRPCARSACRAAPAWHRRRYSRAWASGR